MNNSLFTIEQVDNKLIITVQTVKVEHPNPTMIRSNDGNTETIEFVDPPLTINTDKGGLDLSKYKPFPMGFIGSKVILLEDSLSLKKGSIVSVKTWYGSMATVVADNGIELTTQKNKLAPVCTCDHPDYKDEQTDSPDSRPMNAEEIAAWAYRVKDFDSFNCDQLLNHINILVQYELNKAKR